MHVVLVYLEWFWRNSLLKCVLQPKIAKNSLKPPILGFKVVQGHRCLYHWKACSSACYDKQHVYMSIFNRFHAR